MKKQNKNNRELEIDNRKALEDIISQALILKENIHYLELDTKNNRVYTGRASI